jgi:hypothetical protein
MQFYGEVKKRITDYIKRLLGLPHLSIWEKNTSVMEIGDLEAAKDHVAYLYANPAQDHIEESIEKFPGYSSWKIFQKLTDSLESQHSRSFPWLRLPSIPSIPSSVLTDTQDCNLVRLITKRNKTKHLLIRKPNAWMKCFGIKTDEEVQEINRGILELIKKKEHVAKIFRQENDKQVLGSQKMRMQPILKPHKPKKQGRRVFIITTNNELRMRAIQEFRLFCEACRDCYQRWKQGDFTVSWPPGAFKPPLPPNMNLLPGW